MAASITNATRSELFRNFAVLLLQFKKEDLAMAQMYRLTEDQDDLLSEAEKAFDLSARRQSIGWSEERTVDDEAHTIGRLGFLSGWLRRTEGEKHIG